MTAHPPSALEAIVRFHALIGHLLPGLAWPIPLFVGLAADGWHPAIDTTLYQLDRALTQGPKEMPQASGHERLESTIAARAASAALASLCEAAFPSSNHALFSGSIGPDEFRLVVRLYLRPDLDAAAANLMLHAIVFEGLSANTCFPLGEAGAFFSGLSNAARILEQTRATLRPEHGARWVVHWTVNGCRPGTLSVQAANLDTAIRRAHALLTVVAAFEGWPTAAQIVSVAPPPDVLTEFHSEALRLLQGDTGSSVASAPPAP